MKQMKKMLAAIMMLVILMVGTSFANSGILIAGVASNDEPQPCAQETIKGGKNVNTSNFTGILIAGFTGILVAGFTGILVAGVSETPVECGVILTD